MAFKKMKPILKPADGNYPGRDRYIFNNPIFENYMTSYMEDTQGALAEHLTIDTFKTIKWQRTVPAIVLDMLEYLCDSSAGIDQFLQSLQP